MNLDYALERLYESGWLPTHSQTESYESLPDGRRFPSVSAIEHEFERWGLKLTIKHNLIFNTYRAAWSPIQEALGATPHEPDAQHGTVVGSSECEAAVYALAQFRETRRMSNALTFA